MKSKVLIAIIILINNFIYSQNIQKGVITYTTSISFDTIKIANKFKDNKNYKIIKDETIKILESAIPQLYLLTFKNKKSYFVKEQKIKNENENKVNLIEILGGNGMFYANNLDNEIVHQIDVLGDYFLVECEGIKWELTQQSKKIGDYLCYRANAIKMIENREGLREMPIVAWYASDLPINFGPKNYNGLPGLILELTEGSLTFSAIKIELNPKEQIEIKKPTKGKKVTEEEFKQISKEASLSFFGRN